MDRDPNRDDLLRGAVSAAVEAGSLLLERWSRPRGVEYKGEVDLVTEADRASEELLVERLGRLLPEAGILAEEGSGRTGGTDARWIVDPLDGTTNYAHGYPVFCVSVALEVAGRIVLGVVHDPTRSETFQARAGGGAWCNGRGLAPTREDRLDRALLVTGFPYDVRTSPRNNLPQFRELLLRARAVRRSGSAALDLAYVAAGRFDGFWEEKLAPWDLAAGVLLVEEAGGCVTGYDGAAVELSAGHVVASGGPLQGELLAALRRADREAALPPVTPRS